ncbi:Holliday junction resolvase RuvX [Acaryochloris sp. IP29b_bin.137]|uniref:Holliday junction resolvase RuvX n=1 Tax=Acaryochloris sp. IP29b_bin.137 TaxID=2969217 RepID=UPI00261BE911|nr:Holliday junction resolvase RuvX [Acaryochloris sp. IP29b_bin.137]
MSGLSPSAVGPTPKLQPLILGLDPGRDKCGLAVMGADHVVHWHQVITAAQVIESIETLYQTYPISLLVMGNQTTSREWDQKLRHHFSSSLRMVKVDERYSTLEARSKFWQMYPPKGLGGLIPRRLRSINRPIDDIVAIILIERYLVSMT